MRLKDDLSEGVLDIVRAAKEYSPKDPETGKRHKKVLVNETKSTGSVRHPPIPGFICKALDLHLRTFVPDNLTAFLFTGCRTDFADIQNKKECGGNRQWQNHYLRNWAANTKGKGII